MTMTQFNGIQIHPNDGPDICQRAKGYVKLPGRVYQIIHVYRDRSESQDWTYSRDVTRNGKPERYRTERAALQNCQY